LIDPLDGYPNLFRSLLDGNNGILNALDGRLNPSAKQSNLAGYLCRAAALIQVERRRKVARGEHLLQVCVDLVQVTQQMGKGAKQNKERTQTAAYKSSAAHSMRKKESGTAILKGQSGYR
jgi:hypothetical protein